MSHHEYEAGKTIAALDPPFYGMIMAAMRKADTENTGRLADAFPGVWAEFRVRYHCPGGYLPGETTGGPS